MCLRKREIPLPYYPFYKKRLLKENILIGGQFLLLAAFAHLVILVQQLVAVWYCGDNEKFVAVVMWTILYNHPTHCHRHEPGAAAKLQLSQDIGKNLISNFDFLFR